MTRSTTLATLLVLAATSVASPQGSRPAAAAAFERLKALQGEWVDIEGVFGTKGVVAVTYKVTGGGTAVVETFPLNTPGEMVTVYHMDGDDIVLTHFCSADNQPRMRAKGGSANALSFEFDGGTNVDPKVTSHMHAVKLEFLGPDEIRATWQNWSKGAEDLAHLGVFRVVRKRG